MIREIHYRHRGYRARHVVKLIDALLAQGWTIQVRGIPGGSWCCQPYSIDEALSSRCGSSMWDCLSRAVRDVVIPAEAGEPAKG